MVLLKRARGAEASTSCQTPSAVVTDRSDCPGTIMQRVVACHVSTLPKGWWFIKSSIKVEDEVSREFFQACVTTLVSATVCVL